jgi:hypothetical protein
LLNILLERFPEVGDPSDNPQSALEISTAH